MDCKAHRKSSDLEVVCLHLECEKLDLESFASNFAEALSRFAKFNDCRSIRISDVNPKKLTSVLRDILAAKCD
jgi:hypothetical protein